MSKNMTIRRRSLYLMSPGFSGAIWLAVTGLAAGGSARFSRVFGAAAGSGSGTAVSSKFWNSTNSTFCGLPSSDTTKSEAFRPVMGLPLLSLRMRSSTTSCVLASNLYPVLAGAGAGAAGGWAGCWAEAIRTQARNVAVIGRILEPEPHGGAERAHAARRLQQSELCRAHGRIPRAE